MLIRTICLGLAVVCLVATGTAQQPPINTGDVDCSEAVDVGDITGLVAYLFQGGAEPCDFISSGIAYDQQNDTIVASYPPDWRNWLTVTIDVPNDGWVLLQFSCMGDRKNGRCTVGIGSGGDLDNLNFAIENSGAATITTIDVIAVTTGQHTFTANLFNNVPTDVPEFWNGRLTATYFPVNYGQ